MAKGSSRYQRSKATLRRAWDGRWQRWVFAIVSSIVLIVAGALVWLDTSSGHRFLASRIGEITPKSGLRIHVDAIEGSIYRRAKLKGLTLSDPKGQFLNAPSVELDWWPFAWAYNRLDIDRLYIPKATLLKLPQLNPAERQGPILPGFDIRLMEFTVKDLIIAASITGEERKATLSGDADIRGGRAIIDLSARVIDGEDAIKIALDSRPDSDRFSLDVTVNAPKDGVIAAMSDLKQSGNLRIFGKGGWKRWDGHLAATLDSVPVADLTLSARSGVYSASGTIEGHAIAGKGLVQRLTSPRLGVSAKGRMDNRILSGNLSLESSAVTVVAKGGIDLRNNGFDNVLIDLTLPRPDAVLTKMSGRELVARARVDGPFNAFGYEYLIKARELTFGKTVIQDVRAEGKGRKAKSTPTVVPIKLRARQVDGHDALIQGLSRNFSLDGVLQIKGDQIISNPMQVRSDKLDAKLILIADLKSGRYDVGLDGKISALAIRGLGIVDLTAKLRAAPDASGGFGLSGHALAQMRRMDNRFLHSLGGGLPSLRSELLLGSDGQLHFSDLKLESPLLGLMAKGYRRTDGSFHFEGNGTHRRYGPLNLVLEGKIDRPTVDILLKRPMNALGLADVKGHFQPIGGDYQFTAAGQSTLGPFTGNGVIRLPDGGQAVIHVERLNVASVLASGDILPTDTGLDGRLAVSGTVAGNILFRPVNNVQQVQLALTATDASFDGPTVIAVRRGKIDGTLLLDPDGTTVNATVQARGLRVGGILLGSLAANAELIDGRGTVRGSLSGQRGRLFDLQAEAQVEPDRITLLASGSVDKRPIKLARAAVLNRIEGGWRLSPTTINYAGGSLQVGGDTIGGALKLDARVKQMPLGLLDIAYDNLGLGGVITGSINFTQSREGVPSGNAELRVRGLSRSGLSLSSRPVDVGINAALSADRLATRMIFAADGKTIGRGQALLSPLGTEGGLVSRLNAAQLFAQLRFSGTADTLWRLTGVEIVDIAGPVAVSADMRGTLGDPVITGTLATDNATLTSPVTGMRLNRVKARGHFTGAQLVVSEFSAVAANGGTVGGRGSFTFAGIGGVGMDLAFQADNASLLERDDIAATVTGPLTLKSNGSGGQIAGNVVMNKSRFTMGRAAAVAQIPELNVTEVNRRGDEWEGPRKSEPWSLAVKAVAKNRLTVTGLGLDSEWRADLMIGGTVTNPAISGTADLVRGGYEFAGRRFELREGRIRFDGRTPVNPTLDIEAEADVRDLSATIRVGGTGLQPDISFASVPALPQDELLSRILFGTSITNLSAPEALQLASAVGSLQGGGGLDPINAVRKAAGLDRLRIIPADPTQDQGTAVAAGKYLTRKTYVELISDGQGYSATRIEYQVTRWLSLLGAISTMGRQSANVRVTKDY